MAYTGRPAGVLVVRVCPADVGRRVSLRERLADGRTMSDTVGRLVGWNDGVLTVSRRDGSSALVGLDRLVAAKVVPPEVSAYDVQLVAEAGWPPERRDTLGDWTLRWTHGVTGRANSVRVGDDPGVPLDEALRRVRSWYDALGTRPQLQLPAPWTHDDALTALGWREHRRTLVMTAPVDAVLDRGTRAPAGTTVTTVDDPDDEWLDVLQEEPPADRRVLRQLLVRPEHRVFVAVRDDTSGGLLGVGRASAAPLRGGRARWAGITSIETTPAARRRGIARAVMTELATWSAAHGCTTAYLQMLSDNLPARALYDRLGFTVHHHYAYRSPTD